jgi:hypothetical protein
MEILNSNLISTVKTYRVTVDTDKGKMELAVQVEDDNFVIEHGEINTHVWNKLSHEEKEEIDEILENEFING